MALVLFDLDETAVIKRTGMRVAGFDETDEDDLEDMKRLNDIFSRPHYKTPVSNRINLASVEYGSDYADVEYIIEGVLDVLQQLKAQGHTLGVVTSRKHKDDFFPEGLAVLKDSFTVALGASDELHSLDYDLDIDPVHRICGQQRISSLNAQKSPLIRKIMREQGFSPEQTIYVGDAIGDYYGARCADIRTFINAQYGGTKALNCKSSEDLWVASAKTPNDIFDIVQQVEARNVALIQEKLGNPRGT